ncbi:hypothetical protein E2562_021775 [Oryza meyeriana var. granulata]|uniref:Uncharacterized protein n=1 Tax=Oryza meyeriana var. granulata TaxID=110450 RepID=A0A6G1EY93_9ORYZ|nr:hypothetical protein E2562_021775 [Oryza meyeriana var. granulata]
MDHGGTEVEERKLGVMQQEENFVQRAFAEGFTADEVITSGEHLICIGAYPKAMAGWQGLWSKQWQGEDLRQANLGQAVSE